MKKITKKILACLLGALSLAAASVAFTGCQHRHVWGEWTVVKEGNCTERTVEVRTCQNDRSHTEQRAFFFNHQYDDGEICTLCGERKESEGLEFKLASNGTYRVTGLGDCRDSYIVIPKEYNGVPVAEIGNGAFWGNTMLKQVKLSSNIVRVGNSAFNDCIALETVDFGESVREIGTSSFDGCSSLKQVSLPDSVQTVGVRAFYECTSLESVTAGEGLEYILNEAFFACMKLRTATLGDNVLEIGVSAFAECSELTELSYGNKLQIIRTSAFQRCKKLMQFTIPQTVTELGNYVFRGCSALQEIVIPSSIKEIPLSAFEGCIGLGSVSVAEGVQVIDGSAFKDCTKLRSITLPTTIEKLGEKAFSGCLVLQTLVVSDLHIAATDAFEKCVSLQVVYFYGAQTDWQKSALAGVSGFRSAAILYYSETDQTGTGQYWRFVDGVPTMW